MISGVHGVSTVEENLHQLHNDLLEQMPEIHRLAIALYDAGTDKLITFTHSTLESGSLAHHEVTLADVPSLLELAKTRADRVVPDMSIFKNSGSKHSKMLLEQGFRSSYTKPFYKKNTLCGFLFFDAVEADYFQPVVLRHLSVYVDLAALMVVNALAPADILRSAVSMVRDFSHYRDEDTGSHIDRMSRYTHLLGMSLAKERDLTDEFVEFVYLFAPLHDVGKITIADSILLKEGKLTEDEMAIMRSHVDEGGKIINRMFETFNVENTPNMEILYNIVTFHHEAVDGSGYPKGLKGEEIPLEARIVAVADVFDALTSARPYKAAWSNDEAFAFLEQHAGRKFDADCVRLLQEQVEQIEFIQKNFSDSDVKTFREGYTQDL